MKSIYHAVLLLQKRFTGVVDPGVCLRRADLVIGRAGALTIAELCERSRKLNQERFEVVDFVI